MTSKQERRRKRPWLARPLTGAPRRALVDTLRRRDGDDCFFCLLPMGVDVTLEHLKKWAEGGSNAPGNCVLAHRDCNWATKDLTVDEKMLLRGDMLLTRLAGERAAA